MAQNELNEHIYNMYFGRKNEKDLSDKIQPNNFDEKVYKDDKSSHLHFVESTSNRTYSSSWLTRVADDNIDDIEQLANILKQLCNAAWGSDWGEFSPDLKKGENETSIVLPQITCEINTKDIAEGLGGLKPTLVDIVDEIDGEGNPTGDAFLVYRQWFDSIVEFNIYGRTNKEARQLQKKFEKLISTYSGYLKRQGISEILYEREVAPKFSLNYSEKLSMRCIYYYIRFESITPIRHSLINSINAEIGAAPLSADKVRTLISNSSKNSDPLDLDFFDGDNEITYDF